MSWYLETQRTYLRPIDDGDAENLYALNSDPEVMKYLSPEYKTMEEAREALTRIVTLNKKYNDELGLFAAIEKSSKKFIGWFILRPDKSEPENVKNLEIGYRLMREAWGSGYATEVSQALLNKAVQQFDAERIYAMAMKGNHASIAIMKKIGLEFEKEYIQESFVGEDKTAVLFSKGYDSNVHRK